MATKLTQQISSSIPIRNADLELFSYEQVPLTEETRATHIRLVYPCTEPLESSSQFSYSLELKVVPLDNGPRYEALSYTWGELRSDFPITLNGRIFYITPSLGTALLYACRGRTAPLWIDQICINQKSDEEKNAQLPLMSNIYSGAAEVRIWLGEAADGSDELMDALANAGRKSRECGIETLLTRENFLRLHRWTGGVDQNDLPRRRPFRDLCQEVIPPINVDSFKAWLSRPWFHRVWTVQEFALAAMPSFVCGYKSVPVDDVKYAWIVYVKSPPLMRLAGPSPVLTGEPMPMKPTPESLARQKDLLRLRNEWDARLMSVHQLISMDPLTPLTNNRKRRQMLDDGSGHGSSLFEVLTSLMKSSRECKEPKDWIYGLLALPNDVKKLGIVPDYGLSTETVYSRFTRKAIENGNLEILRYSIYPKSDRSKYPSWVPDWASRPQPSTFDYADDSQIRLRTRELGFVFNASGNTKASVTKVSDEQLLAIQGFVVDEIEELGSPWLGGITQSNNSPERMETLSFLSSVRLLCLLSATKNHPIYPTPERRQEAVWRIPIADLVRVEESTGWQYNARATQAAEQELRHVWAFEERHQERGFSPLGAAAELSRMISREKENGAHRYRSAMSNLRRKRPYITKLGYVGLGPVFARPGDEVVVFAGAAIPFVIRPVKGGYCLLGESYCDGIMDGEILHNIFKLVLRGYLFKAPITKPLQQVLNFGTGTGIWVIDIADEHPSAQVQGTDLSPIQPDWVPPNLKFVVDTCESARPEDEHALYDIIHAGSMSGSVGNWSALFTGAFQSLKPAAGSRCRNSMSGLDPKRASVMLGRQLNVVNVIKQKMIDVGFEDVRDDIIKGPSHWSPAKRSKIERARKMAQAQMLTVLEFSSGVTLGPNSSWLEFGGSF